MEFKELYAFPLEKEKEVEKTHTRKNKKGEETTVTKKSTVKVPVQVRLKRPSRRELEDAELEYSVEMSRCVKKGILTKAMLFKKYSDTGGVWSEDEAKNYGKLYREIFDIQNEYARIETADKKTPEQEKRLEELKTSLVEINKKIVNHESTMQNLFDHTADTKAQNRLLLWYALMLTYVQYEDDESPKPFFEGSDFEDKLEDYYEKEDNTDDFYMAMIKKVSTILAFWFFNQASTPEEFNALIEKVEKGDL
jgi:uncharacterized coiled-coil protein SlyX